MVALAGTMSYDDASDLSASSLMTLGRGETRALIAQLKGQQVQGRSAGEMPRGERSDGNWTADNDDVSSEVGSGDGNLSTTPDSSSSGDTNLQKRTSGDDGDDLQQQADLPEGSPADNYDWVGSLLRWHTPAKASSDQRHAIPKN